MRQSYAKPQPRSVNILNLYAGIGGNRQRWQGNVTAVESNAEIAAIYGDMYPDDTVIVADAHQFLLDNFKNYDFIWSSPPCTTHSNARRPHVQTNKIAAVFPAAELWQEVMLLKHFAKCAWVVENVKAYYKPPVPPSFSIQRHNFWSNFEVQQPGNLTQPQLLTILTGISTHFGVNLDNYKIKKKRQLLRNMLSPEIGEHIINAAAEHISSQKPPAP